MFKKVFLSVLIVMLLAQSALAGQPFAQGYEAARAEAFSKGNLSLNMKSLSLVVGESFQLELLPVGTSPKVSWKSSKKSVATVKKGLVRALKKGKATITVKSKTTGEKAKCKVTVYATAREKIYSEMKKLLKGTWVRVSSEYSSRYYKFSESFIETYDKATGSLLGKGSITSLSKQVTEEGTRYHMVIENNVKLVFPLEEGKLKQAWYYRYQNGTWNYSGSASFVHATYK